MSSRKPSKNPPVAQPKTSRRPRLADPIPTVEEAKRRLAAAAGIPQPWLIMSPENEAVMEEMENIVGGWFVGPADWRAVDTA